MALSERKNLYSQALTVSANVIESFDITHFSGCAVTVKSPAGAAGSVKLQYSNINSSVAADWTDIPTSIIAASATLVAAGSVTLASFAGIHAGFVRAVVTVSAGAGNFDIYYLAKDF